MGCAYCCSKRNIGDKKDEEEELEEINCNPLNTSLFEGCSCCQPIDKTSQEIDEQYMKLADESKKSIKILMLGSKLSGKSTIMNQIKWEFGINNTKYTNEQANKCLYNIRYNMTKNMFLLLQKSQEFYFKNKQKYKHYYIKESKDIINKIEFLTKFNNNETNFQKLGDIISYFWNLPQIKAIFNEREFKFDDNMSYFFNKSNLIFNQNYEISDEDFIKSQNNIEKSMRINEIMVEMMKDKIKIKLIEINQTSLMIDKWCHSFDEISHVIFVANLSDYCIFDEKNYNYLQKTLEMFDRIVNSKYFKKKKFILILNKIDIFRYRIHNNNKLFDLCFDGKNINKEKVGWNTEYFIEQEFKKCFWDENDGNSLKTFVVNGCNSKEVNRAFYRIANDVIQYTLLDKGLITENDLEERQLRYNELK